MRFAFPVLLLVFAAIATLAAGVRSVPVPEIWHALTAFDQTNPLHIVVRDIRLPRLIAGLAAGASLGMAGSIMQSLTRNPLADPGLMGVNAGAAFTIVLGAFLLGRADGGFIAALSFPGAALASLGVFAIGGGVRGETGPVRLTLAGIALNALLMSLVSAIVLTRTEALEVFRFWAAGSLAQANVRPLLEMSTIAALGAGSALLLAPRLEALALGSGLAKGLGTRPGRIQLGALAVVTMLTGAAVSIAGPIAFLGLMVPPLARRISGHTLRFEIMISALFGATILLLADTAGRLLIAPAEIRVGIMTALIGAPVFIWIARRLRPGALT
ncbi:FecCD family ABC transporter permease [Nisaea nitritireducens]|uniref:FecCD family ABC transporter permease n=1 Tax=Nisaea nitritireducens TaxID=568392 RepID=UPI0018684460|nr:iron chelate uptake ABC transporter family permease subunit [Nisaea nitritireducens]